MQSTTARPTTLTDAAELFAGGAPLRPLYALDFEPGAEQRGLIAHTLESLDRGERLCLFPGAAGTGKSTTLSVLLAVLDDCGKQVTVAAPTWKAAGRAEECLGNGTKVRTLHSLVYGGATERLVAKCRACGEMTTLPRNFLGDAECRKCGEIGFEAKDAEFGDELAFTDRDPGSAKVGSVLVIDEASMIGCKFAEAMWAALPPTTRVIAVGDPHQLPPVCEKPGFSLSTARVTLSHVYRQADGSPVLRAATQIRQERAPFTYSHCGADWKRGDNILRSAGIVSSWTDSTQAGAMLAAMLHRTSGDAAAIVGTHKSRVALNDSTRAALGFTPREDGPQVGERLVCRAKGAGLNNADVMAVASVQHLALDSRFGDGWALRVRRPGRERETEIVVLRSMWCGDVAAKHRGLIPWSVKGAMSANIEADEAEFGERISELVGEKKASWKARKGEAAEGWLVDIWRAEAAREVGAWAIYLSRHLASVDTGYAITCHAAQGSQYREIVIVADCVDFIAENEANDVYRWSYTALTRAIENAIIVKKSRGGW